MKSDDWEQLIDAIADRRCAPFLGAGACTPSLPGGAEVARGWAAKHGYPLGDRDDLARVAEYLGITKNAPMYPKHQIRRAMTALEAPEFKGDEPHAVLASLPISVYLTTNYVDYMAAALRERKKEPRVAFCRWNSAVEHYTSPIANRFKPDPANPLVYHLHGHVDVPQSIVLTEADYVEFLVRISNRRQTLEHQVTKALASSVLLFIGYSFSDWDFKVIYGGILGVQQATRELSIAVQLREGDKASLKYLKRYFDTRRIRVYWGDARAFCGELKERWAKR